MRSRLRLGMYLILAVVSIFFLKFEASAQDEYPNRPIEIIVPYAPGGSLDFGVRFHVDKWAEFLGQPVVVVNKPGAGGATGARFVAHAKPDGYTLLGASDSPLIVSRLGRKDAGYDLDSFRLLFYFSKCIMFFSVRSDSKWKTLNGFLTEAKNNPGKLKFSTYGVGGATHYSTEMLSRAAGVKLTLVPFKSGPESTTALISGNVDMAVTIGLSGVGSSGMIRPLAVADEQRAPDFPEVPTLRELGYNIGYTSMYLGLAIPGGVPDKVIIKWTEAHDKVRKKYANEIKEKLIKLDQYPAHMEGKAGMQLLIEREKLYKEFASQVGLKGE